MIDFPNSPTVGQQFTAAGATWTWDGAKWLPSGLSPTVVPGINDNRIINGDMRIDARNNGASGTATNVYTIDRWYYAATQAAKGTWQRGAAGAALAALGFPYYLTFASSSAYASLAGDTFEFIQIIEADMVSDFAWGTSGAQPVTLSFWAFSTLTGTFSGALRNYPSPSTRSYPFTFSLPSASTWTKIAVTIPGDTAGTWTMSGNGGAIIVDFDLGDGATFRGSAGAWTAGNLHGATGAVNVIGTNGASIGMTGVKLEIGSVATPYNRQSLTKSLADCQRYYQVETVFVGGYGASAATLYDTYFLPVTMRAAPTVVFTNPTYANASTLSNTQVSTASFTAQITMTATATGWGQSGTTFSAEL